MSRRLRTDVPMTTWFFYVLLAAGIIGRIALIFTPFFQPNSDNSVVYLEAVHISHGEWQTFYWGQSYGGTLLQIISAAVMVVAGPHIAIVSVVSILFWAAAAWFTRGIALELFGTQTGDVAGVFAWLPGIGAVMLSMLDPGFYGPTLALALCIGWLVVRGAPGKGYLTFLILGALFGLALWEATMGAALAAPFILWQMARQRSWRHWLVGAGGVLIGAAPWWTHLLRPGGTGILAPHGHNLFLINFKIFATRVMPLAFWTDGTNYWPRYATAFTVAIGALVIGFSVVAAIRKNVGALILVAGGGLAYSR